MVLAFLMVFFGVRSYRDNVAGGSVTFGRAFKVGLMITARGQRLLRGHLGSDLLQVHARFRRQVRGLHRGQGEESPAPRDAQIAAKAKEMAEFKEMYKNPLVNIAFTFLEPLPVGLVFTLVTAGVLSRKHSGVPGDSPSFRPVSLSLRFCHRHQHGGWRLR